MPGGRRARVEVVGVPLGGPGHAGRDGGLRWWRSHGVLLWAGARAPRPSPPAAPGATTGLTILRYLAEKHARAFIRRVFGIYVPAALLAQVEPAQVEPALGGQAGVQTAYFTDIASFSSFAEVLGATQLVDLLLEYLTAMTDILHAEHGTLDKYEGDAIVAFFGAPIALEDHAARALRTALRMQQALAQLREKWACEDKWPAWCTRCACASASTRASSSLAIWAHANG